MYTDFYLKFDSPAAADAVLFDEQTNVQGDTVETVKKAKYAAVDVVGTIYEPTGAVVDDEPVMAALDGWHVNVRHNAEAPELEAYRVFPATPQRMWF